MVEPGAVSAADGGDGPHSSTRRAATGTAPPLLFGKYEVGKLVGWGAFAKVYHARDARTGQSVAIKAVSKQRVAKGGLTANIKREIAIMHRLRHPHIVRLLEVLANKTKIYFVMEFAKGGELFTKVSKGRFSEDLSRRYFQQLISAVGYCHSRGVFHRDLKPENLLLDDKLDLKVSDFGLSAVNDDQIRSDGLLHTLCGTPAYVAPEILAKKGYDGAKVDVWSCGIILFVLNAGYLPFNDTNLMVMYRKIYKGEFRVPKWTSPDLRRLITRLLDINPATRITVDEIIRDPWFKQGCDMEKMKFYRDDSDFKRSGNAGGNYDDIQRLNAFDIISLSPGFNLSGLFGDGDASERIERFVSAETPEKIVEKVAEAGEAEDLTVTRKEVCGVKLEGQNCNLVSVVVEIHRLTDELVMVEATNKGRDVGPGRDVWKDKLQPRLGELVYKPVDPVTGDNDDLITALQ